MCNKHEAVDLGFTTLRYPAGTHICSIYNNEEERIKIISQFLASGLSTGEKVGYFADATSKEEVISWLDEIGIQIQNDTNQQQFTINSTEETYYPQGEFVPEKTLETMKSYYTNAMSEGFPAVRVSGETAWALKEIPGSSRLIEYEAKINEVFKEYPITAICQFDANKFDGKTIFECLKVHPFMIVHGQIVKNPYYLDTEEYLKTLETVI